MNHTQIIWGGNTELRSGWRLRPHSHDFFHMTYVAHGNIRYIGDGTEFLLASDDLILIAPGVVHEIPLARTLCSLYEIKFRISNQELLQRFDSRKVIVVHNASLYKKLITNILAQRFVNKKFESDCNDSFMSTILFSLIVEEPDSYASHSVDTSGYTPFINAVIQFIESNFSSEYDLSDLAASLGHSKSYLCNKFRKETGCTMTEYLHYIRIRGLLGFLYYNSVANEISIKMMAENRGYYNPPYFNRIFKKYTGMSPTEFLETLRKETATSQQSTFIDYYEKYCYIGRYPIKESLEYMHGLKDAAEKSALSDNEQRNETGALGHHDTNLEETQQQEGQP